MSRPDDGYETLLSHLTTLLTTTPPSFLYIHDPATPRISASLVRAALQTLDVQPHPLIAHAHVSALAAFTPRLFFDTVLNALAGHTPCWEDGCLNWSAAEGERYNESVDAFVHGLVAVCRELGARASSRVDDGKGKGKGKQKGKETDKMETRGVRLVVVVERAERLKEHLPDLVVPLTRLAEITRLDLTTIFHSELSWEHIRPSLGASPDPFYLSAPALSKQTIVSRLAALFPSFTPASSSPLIHKHTHHPALRPLFAHFVETVYNVCSPFVFDPDELAYIVAARWPGFVKPIVDGWDVAAREKWRRERRRIRRGGDGNLEKGADADAELEEDLEEDPEEEGEDEVEVDPDEYLEPTPPGEDTRLRLTRLFTPSLTIALELLYPRLTTASAFLTSYAPPQDLLAYPPRDAALVLRDHVASTLNHNSNHSHNQDDVFAALTRMSKFILIAAFVASTNPAKTDVRMFGRAKDESVRKRRGGAGVAARRGGSPRKRGRGRGAGTAVKIPQRLLGPLPFPLDRLLAILGILLEEHDTETRPPMPQYVVPGEYTEVEISRLEVYRQINTLTSMHLLHRASASSVASAAEDMKMELSPSLTCGISYEVALDLARDIGVHLGDLLWENEW